MSKIIEYDVNFIDNITISSLVVTGISAGSLNISGAVTLPANISTTNLTTSNLIATNSIITNVVTTNISTNNLRSSGISSLQNVTLTNASIGSMNATGITTSNLHVSSLISAANVFSTNLTTSNLVSTNITVTNISTSTLITGTSGILIGSNTYDNTIFINALDPGMPAGEKWLAFGQSASNNNRAEINFNWVTSGSISNSVSIGLYGSKLMTLRADGNVGIGTSSPTVKLDVYSDDISSNSLRLLDLKRNLSDGANVGSFMGKNTNARNGLWSWYHHISDGNNDNYVHYDWNGYLNAMTLNARGRVGLSTTAPTNTLHVNGDLRVSSFITTSNLICTNLTTNSLSIPVISDVPAIDPNMTNTLIIHEDFTGTKLRSGTTSGNALYYIQNGQGILPGGNTGYLILTLSLQNQSGYLSWKINPGNAFSLTFDHYAGGGSGADAISFSWSSDNISSFGTGYCVEFNDLNSRIRLRFNGVELVAPIVSILGNGAWHKSTITFYRNQIRVIYDGVVVINYTDTTFRNVNGAYMYFYSFTGSLTNFHAIRNIRMSKVTEGLWQYQESTSGNIVYDGGNVGIGIDPGYTLHVDGSVRLNSTRGILIGSSTDLDANRFISALDSGMTANGSVRYIAFGQGASTNNQAELAFQYVGNNNTQNSLNLGFFGGERMRIQANGSVGIGTNTPNVRLHVNSGDTSVSDLRLFDITRNMANGARVTSFFGKNYDARNGLYTGYYHTGNNSFDNYVHYDFNGTNNVLVLTAGGGVGIGTNVLNKAKFQVNGSVNSDIGGYAYLNRDAAVNVGSGTWPYSIYATDRIAAAEFNAFSDIRIKENIQDVDDLSALSTLRLIEPKKYNYIDKVTRGEKPVWGFIAQQVASVLDYSTGRIIDYIPSVYDTADVTNTENVTTIKLKNKTTNGLTSTTPVKIKLFTDEKNTVFIATLKDIIDENTFTINESLNETSQVFVYGIEVSDFHTLNKDAIYTINVAATQELDRQHQVLNNKCSVIEQKYSDLEQKYSDLEQKYSDLEQKYNDIITLLQK